MITVNALRGQKKREVRKHDKNSNSNKQGSKTEKIQQRSADKRPCNIHKKNNCRDAPHFAPLFNFHAVLHHICMKPRPIKHFLKRKKNDCRINKIYGNREQCEAKIIEN